MPGVGAYGAAESRRWAEQAAESRRAGRDGAAAQRLPRRRARRPRALSRRSPRPACRSSAYNNPIDTKVDLTPPLLAKLHDEGLIVARQGVLRRRPPRLRDRRAGPGPRPADRHRRHRARGRRSPAPRAGSPATRTPSRRPASSSTAPSVGRRPGHGAAALPAAAPAAALGLQDRVRPGDQAVHGHGRPQGRRLPARRASRCSPEQDAVVARSRPTQALDRRRGCDAEPPCAPSVVLHAVDSHTEGMPTRVITGGVGRAPGRHHGRAAAVVHGEPRRPAHAADVRTARPRLDVRRDPAAADPAGRRLRGPLHRGVRLPADVRARHDRRRHGARRDRHGRGRRAGDHDPARHPGRPGRRRGRRRGRRGRRRSRSRNVPSFCRRRSTQRSTSPGSARSRYDLAYGGNFYAIVELDDLGLPFDRAAKDDCSTPAWPSWTPSTSRTSPVHPEDPAIRGCHHVYLDAPGLDAAALPARDGDPPRLVRPVALRHRHQRPDGAAARPRSSSALRHRLRQRVLHRHPLQRPAPR